MRLGLYGGTFDPVHLGHLLLAEQCREQLNLDEVWFLPTGNPPHKQGSGISPAKARVEMLEIATAGHRGFIVNEMEVEREGTTFTVDTLQQLHDEDPDRALFFLIGADSLSDLPTWREPGRIVQLATVVAVNRGGGPYAEPGQIADAIGSEAAARIETLSMPGIEISSREIRRCVGDQKSIRYMTPRGVEAYIEQNKMYRE